MIDVFNCFPNKSLLRPIRIYSIIINTDLMFILEIYCSPFLLFCDYYLPLFALITWDITYSLPLPFTSFSKSRASHQYFDSEVPLYTP